MNDSEFAKFMKLKTREILALYGTSHGVAVLCGQFLLLHNIGMPRTGSAARSLYDQTASQLCRVSQTLQQCKHCKYACTTLVDGLGQVACSTWLPVNSRARMRPFQENCLFIFQALVTLKLLISFISRIVACSGRIIIEQTDRQTDKPSTVTLAANALWGLIIWCKLNAPLFCSRMWQFAVVFSSYSIVWLDSCDLYWLSLCWHDLGLWYTNTSALPLYTASICMFTDLLKSLPKQACGTSSWRWIYGVYVPYSRVFLSVLNFVLFVLFLARTNIFPHKYLYMRGCDLCAHASDENIRDENLYNFCPERTFKWTKNMQYSISMQCSFQRIVNPQHTCVVRTTVQRFLKI